MPSRPKAVRALVTIAVPATLALLVAAPALALPAVSGDTFTTVIGFARKKFGEGNPSCHAELAGLSGSSHYSWTFQFTYNSYAYNDEDFHKTGPCRPGLGPQSFTVSGSYNPGNFNHKCLGTANKMCFERTPYGILVTEFRHDGFVGRATAYGAFHEGLG